MWKSAARAARAWAADVAVWSVWRAELDWFFPLTHTFGYIVAERWVRVCHCCQMRHVALSNAYTTAILSSVSVCSKKNKTRWFFGTGNLKRPCLNYPSESATLSIIWWLSIKRWITVCENIWKMRARQMPFGVYFLKNVFLIWFAFCFVYCQCSIFSFVFFPTTEFNRAGFSSSNVCTHERARV